MRGSPVLVIICAAALLVAAVALQPSPPPGDAHPGTATAAAAEIERVRAHLEAVERELADGDVAHLTKTQRAARARHMAVLREYRERGEFPHNHHVADRRVPVFVDEHGTHCAVGYLLARSGRDDIVARIANTRNLATVPELADDAALAAWLDEAGLSVDDAARIQPWYSPWPPDENATQASPGYATASIVATGLGGGMIAWNLAGGSEAARGLRGGLGLGVGLGGVALGGLGMIVDRHTERDVDAAHIALNLGIGLVSSALGVRTLMRRPQSRLPAAAAGGDDAQALAPPTPRESVQWSLAPWSPGTDGGAGVRLHLRFQ